MRRIKLDRRKATFVAMWGAAISAAFFIWLGQPGEEAAPPRHDDEGAPVRVAGEDPASPERRAGLPVRPPEEGPPRTFRVDRRHTARSPYRGPVSAEVAWTFEAEGRITSQVAVAPDGTLYVGSHDHHLYALSPHGLLRWKKNLGERIYATPLVGDDGNVYVGCDGDTFWSLTAEGEVRWRIETDGDADTGAVQAPGGVIHFAAGRSLWAVRPDGAVQWRFEAREKIYSTPAVDDDGTVYVGSQDDHLYAIAPDGRTRWSYEARDDVDSSPVIGDDGTIYFGSDDHHVYAVDRDGELRWATDLDGYVRAPVALGIDGSVLAGVFGPRPRVVSLDGQTGDLRWYFPVTVADTTEIGVASGPLVDVDGNVYVGAHDDFLYSLAPTGDLRWIFEARGDVDGAPVLAPDGTLYVGSDDHTLYALRAWH